ncbi:hypothetical protein FNV43_RR24463 [Rhamnella rubrinervis]|uniref:Sister chromatid cohesion 1 protein 1 n=1 Tax=Rhamnella rubrinervis TaxID=2594499 RepID=A0A8K0GQ94_9ROSA|nr:hypothetical protein FNV43_RR24463 [Rhamnella rubrinervis]
MAATMHAKINRRKLDKLNIIKICEEILNPAVPMALRLSGILMGGVVIVYERKIEINEAWKVKAAPDPTVLPKGKSQAKSALFACFCSSVLFLLLLIPGYEHFSLILKESVTLPDKVETDFGDIEQSLNYSNTNTIAMGFQQTDYFAMLCSQRLDSLDEPYINVNPKNEDPTSDNQHFHQAEADNITLFEHFDSYQVNADLYNRFERFDIEGDEDTQLNFTSVEHTQMPTTLIPSPPQDELQGVNEMQDQTPDLQVNQREDESKEVGRSWLGDASDIVSRSSKRKRTEIMSAVKIVKLMELPHQVLIDDLFTTGSKEIYYPSPLLKQWMKSSQPVHDSPSARTSPPLPPEPSSSSLPVGLNYQDQMEFPFKDFQSGVGSQSLGVSIEKQRKNLVDNNIHIPTEILMDELRANLMNNGVGMTETNLMETPGNSRFEVRSIPSSASGGGIPSHTSEVNSGRSSKKRTYSASGNSSGGLEPVAEEYTWHHADPNFKLARLSENGLSPDQELLAETGTTQTQQPFINPPVDKVTDSIRMQMKAHFDTPGAPQVESFNNLATGMNRRGAALFFYQTCVLATRGFLRVEQQLPYGDILISKGAKM